MSLLQSALPVFGASLLGSVHCASMCGAVAAIATQSAPGQQVPPRQRPVYRHAAYQGGRLAAYLVVGAIAGQLGSWLNSWGSGSGWQRWGALLSFGLMALWAAAMLMPTLARPERLAPELVPAGRLSRARRRPSLPSRTFASLLQRSLSLPDTARALLLGLGTGALPCGWLYGFVALAAGSGSAVGGAVTLFAFWLGAIPLLSGAGALLHGISARARGALPAVAAAVMLLVGGVNLWGRLDVAVVGDRAHDGVAEPPACH